VKAVSATQALPLARNSWRTAIHREGNANDLDSRPPIVYYGITRPNYFRTMGIPIRSGREFTAQDGPNAAPVALVSESAARTLWPNQDPLGKRFTFGREDSVWKTVIGVVADLRQNIRDSEPPAQVYEPHMQHPVQTLNLVVRGNGDLGALNTALRRLIQSRDPDLPLYSAKTMKQAAYEALWEQRIYAWLMALFAGLALLIAAVGIYGVMAYSVSQRTHEIGIRMALGAARDDVVRMVVGQALRLTAIGVGIGLAAAYAVTRLMASLLFGVSASDPPTFIGVAVILAASGIVAAWVPTMRATRVDPMVALRAE
jgi:putative ABC transport system permease protein